MTQQQFSDLVSEAIYMDIEDIDRIEEKIENGKTNNIVLLKSGEQFIVTVHQK